MTDDDLGGAVTYGEANERAGITSAMLLRWSRDGLVHPLGRSAEGRQLYDLAELIKLRDSEPPRPGQR